MNTRELGIPEQIPFPYQKEYETDVVVVGCGFSGLNAAYAANQKGQRVLVVDKGRPGYSGLSPWPSSFRWFDPDRDDANACRRIVMKGGEYMSNMNWYDLWIRESKKIYERLMAWGIIRQYPKASEAGDFYEKEDFPGYRETYEKFDRHLAFANVLDQNGIPWLEHVMVCDVFIKDDRVQGIIGFHVPTGEFITVRAKAVILATGGGAYKPTGFPVGGNTFDGEYICYHLGLPITGKEFEDFHGGPQAAPGSAFLGNHWTYVENIWLCGGDMTSEGAEKYTRAKSKAMVMRRIETALHGAKESDGSDIASVANADYTRRGASVHYGTDPGEIRSGKMNSDMQVSGAVGAAIGMCSHLASGVFTGTDDLSGATQIAGLYVSGDGIHATAAGGAAYPCGVGFTSCFTSLEGDHVGTAAAEYAAGVPAGDFTAEEAREKEEILTAPYRVKEGVDPNWAVDVLHGIMSPYWVLAAKSGPMLQAALLQVEYMRENVVPKLMAKSGHDLRIAIEARNKILSAELKLRASLERKESRGNSYRTDYPYRDDENYLKYILAVKGRDGKPVYSKVPVNEAWTGDRQEPYEKRFSWLFPGEAKALGLTVEERR